MLHRDRITHENVSPALAKIARAKFATANIYTKSIARDTSLLNYKSVFTSAADLLQ